MKARWRLAILVCAASASLMLSVADTQAFLNGELDRMTVIARKANTKTTD